MASLALAASLAAPQSAPQGDVLIDRPGFWSLERLGSGPLDLAPGREKASVSYRLPDGERQGPKRWYLIRLHFSIKLAALPDAEGTEVLVSASPRGATSESVRFEGDRWTNVDIVRGVETGPIVNGTAEVDVENFFQSAGVRGGRNVMTFDYDEIGDAKVESVHVFPDTGILVSRRSPAHLRLRATPPRRKLHAGDRFTVPYRLTNTGDRPAYSAGVFVESLTRAVRVVGRRGRSVVRLGGHRHITGRFRLRARRAGRALIDVSGGSAVTNAPLVEIGGWILP